MENASTVLEGHPSAAPLSDVPGRVPVSEVLGAIAEFGLASVGLVAWELCLPEEAVTPTFGEALSGGLIEPVGRCPCTRERMYRLAASPSP